MAKFNPLYKLGITGDGGNGGGSPITVDPLFIPNSPNPCSSFGLNNYLLKDYVIKYKVINTVEEFLSQNTTSYYPTILVLNSEIALSEDSTFYRNGCIGIIGNGHTIDLNNYVLTFQESAQNQLIPFQFSNVIFNAQYLINPDSESQDIVDYENSLLNIYIREVIFSECTFKNFNCKDVDENTIITALSRNLTLDKCKYFTDYKGSNINTCPFLIEMFSGVQTLNLFVNDFYGNQEQTDSSNLISVYNLSYDSEVEPEEIRTFLNFNSDGSVIYEEQLSDIDKPVMPIAVNNVYNVNNLMLQNALNSFKNNVSGVRVMTETAYQALSPKETDVLYFTY